MSEVKNRIISDLQRKPWGSATQLLIGGLVIYLIALYAGPYYGCGPGNSDSVNGAFACMVGEMSLVNKGIMLFCIVFASLCWGRAMKLLDVRSVMQK